MIYNNKLNFYVPIFVFLIMVYRSSWLPGASFLLGNSLYLIIVSGLFLFVFNFDFNKFLGYRLFRKNPYRTYSIFIIFAVIVSIFLYNIQEVTKFNSLIRLLAYLSTFYIYLILFPKIITSDKNYLRKFISFISNFGFVCALFGFLTLNSHPVGKFQGMLVSFITHPNNTSIIFTFTIPATLYLYFVLNKDNFSLRKYYLIFSVIIQIFAQLFTLTRAGMIATFIGLLIFLIFKYRFKVLWLSPLILPIPFFASGFFYAKGAGSFFSRLFLLIPAYYMITENKIRFLWGYGITDAFLKYRNSLLIYNITEENIDDPHNTYISLLIMFGAVITVLLISFMIYFLYKIYREYSVSSTINSKFFYIFSFSFLISLFIQGFFDSEIVIVEYFTIQFMLTIIGINTILISRRRHNINIYTLLS
jgi:hypothetical protein